MTLDELIEKLKDIEKSPDTYAGTPIDLISGLLVIAEALSFHIERGEHRDSF